MSVLENPMVSTLCQYAIIVDPQDKVTVVKQKVEAEAQIELPDGRIVAITSMVTPGQRFATRRSSSLCKMIWTCLLAV